MHNTSRNNTVFRPHRLVLYAVMMTLWYTAVVIVVGTIIIVIIVLEVVIVVVAVSVVVVGCSYYCCSFHLRLFEEVTVSLQVILLRC